MKKFTCLISIFLTSLFVFTNSGFAGRYDAAFNLTSGAAKRTGDDIINFASGAAKRTGDDIIRITDNFASAASGTKNYIARAGNELVDNGQGVFAAGYHTESIARQNKASQEALQAAQRRTDEVAAAKKAADDAANQKAIETKRIQDQAANEKHIAEKNAENQAFIETKQKESKIAEDARRVESERILEANRKNDGLTHQQHTRQQQANQEHFDKIKKQNDDSFLEKQRLTDENKNLEVASNKPKYVDLTDARGKRHILEGDANGGGHRFGTGQPGKSEFPSTWSDEKILHEISDVATSPSSTYRTGRGGRTIAKGTGDGVDIKVVIENPNRGERIVTGFPTNTPRNPK